MTTEDADIEVEAALGEALWPQQRPSDRAEAKSLLGSGTADFKQAFRSLAAGIAVVTFEAGSDIHGFTATSVTSVSMEPPMALFCAGNSARSRLYLEPGRRLGLSFLGAAQQDVAQFFAARRPFGHRGEIVIDHIDGVPVIDDAAAVISATIDKVVPAGDHVVCICRLNRSRTIAGRAPLLYFNGGYGGFVPLA
jgi:flavin reductase (DIM6/NTAB) family NADH-FMN oxidoreductase RutF